MLSPRPPETSGEHVRVAVLGLGEAGSLIAADLVAAGADVRGFDPEVTPPAGVEPRNGDDDAVRDAELVLSVNSAADALAALRNARPALRPGTLWADLNTAAPRVKQSLANEMAGDDVTIVDVALLAPVPGKGLCTPMLASGPGAERYAHLLRAWGATVDVLDRPPGAAISRKLLRSVFYKGLAAAVVEALAGASAAGVEDWLRDNIRAELAAFDERTLDRLVDGTHAHARRRTGEMAAAAEQLEDLGVRPRVAEAARDLLADLSHRTGASLPTTTPCIQDVDAVRGRAAGSSTPPSERSGAGRAEPAT
jgi:3-hydroxyisobutyrate dehydrogenase-like beta-hydroxyacid dehydrogenase